MTTFYVGTISRYVLVNAENETAARDRGRIALHDLYEDVRKRLGQETPIEIRTVRVARDDEIALRNWHERIVAGERTRENK